MPRTPISEPVIRFTWGGPVGSDVWNTSAAVAVALTTPSGPSNANMVSAANYALGAFQTMWTTGLDDFNAPECIVNRCDALYYPAGSIVATRQGSFANAGNPGTAALRVPYSTAICLSLRSELPGPSGRGRMYLPATAGYVDADGNFPAALMTPVAAAAGAFLTAIDGLAGAVPAAFTNSEICIQSWTSGTARRVSDAWLDDAPDTQRRRDEGISSIRYTATGW